MRISGIALSACEVALPVFGAALCLGLGAGVHRNAGGHLLGRAAQHRDPQPQVRVARARGGAQNVAFAQDRRQIAGQMRGAQAARFDQHVRNPRMHAEFLEHAAMRRDAP